MTVSQVGFRLLRLLVEEGPVTPTELSRRTHIDPAVVTRQVQLLERDGLTTRTKSGEDGRVSSLAPTAQGRRTVQRMGKVLNRHMLLALESWKPEDIATLAGLLERLVDDLRAIPYPELPSG